PPPPSPPPGALHTPMPLQPVEGASQSLSSSHDLLQNVPLLLKLKQKRSRAGSNLSTASSQTSMKPISSPGRIGPGTFLGSGESAQAPNNIPARSPMTATRATRIGGE